MARLLLTLSGWVVLALLFLGVARWIKARSRGRFAAERPSREAGPGGPPLEGTSEPLPALLEPLRSQLQPLLAPCAQLVAGGIPVVRLGGDARLPPGAEWPRSPSHPMSFVGEIDLVALRCAAPEPSAALPEEGWLALFYDVAEMPWGYEPAHGAFFRLLHLTGELEKRSAPAGATVYPETPLGARPTRVLPDPEDLPEGLKLGPEPLAAYREVAAKLVADPDHRVAGHPRWIRSDAAADVAVEPEGEPGAVPTPARGTRAGLGPAATRVWRLLWQIDTDPAAGFMWGTGGRLYLLAREEDLKARRFDRVWLVLKCY